MDIRTESETGKLTLIEAAELSRLLEQKWGSPSVEDGDEGDFIVDFVAPLFRRIAATLTPPQEHLEAIRAKLAKVAVR